jgi:hypothetical protein
VILYPDWRHRVKVVAAGSGTILPVRPGRVRGSAVRRVPERGGSGPGSRRALLGLVLLAALGGCATRSPEQLAREQAERAERVWVLLTPTPWDAKIIRYLRDAGFAVTPKDKPVPGARYGLTVTAGQRLDYCVLNTSEKFARVTYEVTDLETKAVVLTATRAGWTGPCFVQWTEVFDELAEVIRAEWTTRRR